MFKLLSAICLMRESLVTIHHCGLNLLQSFHCAVEATMRDTHHLPDHSGFTLRTRDFDVTASNLMFFDVSSCPSDPTVRSCDATYTICVKAILFVVINKIDSKIGPFTL